MKKRIIHTQDLCKSFTSGNVEQQVLKNLNLEIYKGDFTVIMGNSGSGKSTLLYALSGMDTPSMGAITYETGDEETTRITGFNNDQLARFRRDHVGFVFQQNYLNDSMSALDNVMVVGLLKNSNRKELAKKAKAQNLDAIHDTVHEMARDEARHGKAFKGLLDRYFAD